MNIVERVDRLRRCSMLPGSFDKRFVRSLMGLDKLSDKQLAQVERLEHRYRRQLAKRDQAESS